MQTDKPGSLSDKFGGFGAAPTDQLWNSITTALDQKEKKKRGAFWWWFGGIAASIVLLFGIYQLGYQLGKSDAESVAEETNLPEPFESISENSTTTHEISNQQSSPEDVLVSESTSDDEHIEKNKFESAENSTENHSDHSSASNESAESIIGSSKNQIGANWQIAGNVPREKSILSGRERLLNEVEIVTVSEIPIERIDPYSCECALPPEGLEGKWELGIASGFLTGFNAHNQKMLADQNPPSVTSFDNLSTENTINGTGGYASITESDASIKRPWNLEFSVARKFGNRWTLASGIGLNSFKSRNSYPTSLQGVEFFNQSSFLSISVPLIADFDFVNYQRFESSVGLGVVNEFPFFARTESTDDFGEISETKNFVDGYMGAVILRTGFSYRFNEDLKIGLSPNVRYYFYQSLQNDTPVLKRNLWGGVSLGLTWTL